MEEYIKKMNESKERISKIKELAESILEQMTKLDLTYNEYEMLKIKLDFLVKSLPIKHLH